MGFEIMLEIEAGGTSSKVNQFDEDGKVGAQISGTAAPPTPQDPAALARLARVSMKFDRVLLRPGGDALAAPPSRGADSRKREGDGGRR